MLLSLRPVTHELDIRPTAASLVELTRLKPVASVLRAYFPGVAERYSEMNSAISALERAISRPDVSAYLLMLVQGKRIGHSDLVSYRDGQIYRQGYGVIHINRGPRDHERIVGMATYIGGQGLSGLMQLSDPTTWLPKKDWTNVAMWCDPRLGYHEQSEMAEHVASLAPAKSFVTLSGPIEKGSQVLVDPSQPLTRTRQFTYCPIVRPRKSRKARGDGIVSTLPLQTFLNVHSEPAIQSIARERDLAWEFGQGA